MYCLAFIYLTVLSGTNKVGFQTLDRDPNTHKTVPFSRMSGSLTTRRARSIATGSEFPRMRRTTNKPNSAAPLGGDPSANVRAAPPVTGARRVTTHGGEPTATTARSSLPAQALERTNVPGLLLSCPDLPCHSEPCMVLWPQPLVA